MNASEKIEYLEQKMCHDPIVNAAVFSIIRTLGRVYPDDVHLKIYWDKYAHHGKDFVDFYHLIWHIGAIMNPRNIMEIGCRTGVSICELLSSMPNLDGKRVVLFDRFLGETLNDTDNRNIDKEMVKNNLMYLNLPADMVEFIVGHSLRTIADYRKKNPDIKFDYILVDGAHDYATEKIDMDNSAEMLAPGGVMLMDDIAETGGEPGRELPDLWDEFKSEHRDKFLFAENFIWKGVGVAVKKDGRQ